MLNSPGLLCLGAVLSMICLRGRIFTLTHRCERPVFRSADELKVIVCISLERSKTFVMFLEFR